MHRSTFLRRAAAFFLPAAVLATFTAGLAYAVVQQDLRSGANDPQFQMAEDAVARLNAGGVPADQPAQTRVDSASSLAPFLIVFDTNGAPLTGNAVLDGSTPVPPGGVLDSARSAGQDVVTWQPRDGVRIAAVVLPWRGGTVLAGRSLRLVEERESNIELIAAAAWLVGLAALAAASLVASRLWPEPGFTAVRS